MSGRNINEPNNTAATRPQRGTSVQRPIDSTRAGEHAHDGGAPDGQCNGQRQSGSRDLFEEWRRCVEILAESTSGELRFSIVPDYENPQDSGTNNVYVVEVIATSGTGDRIRETTKTLTVTVTDVNEPPGTPNAPTVSADSETSLLVTWTEPANEGGPPITGYNYQYKKTSDRFARKLDGEDDHADRSRSTTISPLDPNTLTPNTVVRRPDPSEGTQRGRAAGRRREPVRRECDGSPTTRHRGSPAPELPPRQRADA